MDERRTRPRESDARTQRVLGLAGLFALGATGTIAVVGIVVVAVWPAELRTGLDADAALTALSTVAAAAVGALAGWFARGQLYPDVKPVPAAPDAPAIAPTMRSPVGDEPVGPIDQRI